MHLLASCTVKVIRIHEVKKVKIQINGFSGVIYNLGKAIFLRERKTWPYNTKSDS